MSQSFFGDHPSLLNLLGQLFNIIMQKSMKGHVLINTYFCVALLLINVFEDFRYSRNVKEANQAFCKVFTTDSVVLFVNIKAVELKK